MTDPDLPPVSILFTDGSIEPHEPGTPLPNVPEVADLLAASFEAQHQERTMSASDPLASVEDLLQGHLARDSRCTAILDMNHGDLAHADLAKIRAEGKIVALFLKCSQGKDWHDPAFVRASAQARELGFLLGAYHFGSNSSPGHQQADLFLGDLAASHPGPVVLMLDHETNPDKGSGTMSMDNARAFAARIRERTGRWPVYYSFTSFIGDHFGHDADSVLGACALFQAQYGPEPRHIHPTWPGGMTLWQYTNGGDGPPDQHAYPRKTLGVGGCDRSAFMGDEAALRAWWAAQAVTL